MPMLKANSHLHFSFLPGWGFEASIWHDTAESLTQNFLLVDLPKNNNHLLNNFFFEKLIDELNQKIPENSHLIAWSLGGLIAIYLCYKYPNKYSKLFLVCSTPKFIQEENWLGISQTQASYFLENSVDKLPQVIKKFLNLVQFPYHSTDIKKYLIKHLIHLNHQAVLYNYLNLLMKADFRSFYQKLNLPIIHICGEKDAIMPLAMSLEFSKLSPSSVIKTIAHAGHIPFITHKDQFRDLILSNVYIESLTRNKSIIEKTVLNNR